MCCLCVILYKYILEVRSLRLHFHFLPLLVCVGLCVLTAAYVPAHVCAYAHGVQTIYAGVCLGVCQHLPSSRCAVNVECLTACLYSLQPPGVP